jgi:putative membrane protein
MPGLVKPMTTLSEAECARIAAAIAAAERGTAGEIVVMVAARSGAYRSLPPSLALAGALLVPWPLILLTGLSATRIFLVQLAVALALLLGLSAAPSLARLPRALPRAFRRARARAAARHEFQARGLARTRGRTGVLIYVALAERYADVVTDTGVGTAPDAWRPVLDDLVAALRRDALAEGLVRAVAGAGALLAEAAPPRPGDADELPNRVIVTE